MKEREYIAVTNRVKVSMALEILRDVLPGEEYGISHIQLSEIISRLSIVQDKLFKSYKCTADRE